MKVTKRYNQHRRDCTIDMECEGCKTEDTYRSAYNDRNFWDNVVPHSNALNVINPLMT